jgi:hypothetical protein
LIQHGANLIIDLYGNESKVTCPGLAGFSMIKNIHHSSVHTKHSIVQDMREKFHYIIRESGDAISHVAENMHQFPQKSRSIGKRTSIQALNSPEKQPQRIY